ncbi:MAG: NAD(P)/FAD-dependent oxidoreductase [Clostridia bacterium]|nr:NAD(P)/FAD-dependent oxidoreductase [Clostridia bacterium]
MSKVLIIGGGISGLSAGIYLQANGFETEVLEKNHVTGGACIGWERRGCYIDGCIHWLSGVNPKSTTYPLWREIHAIKEDTEIFYQDDLCVFDYGEGKKFTFYADLQKLENELISFAPEDERAIKHLCKLIKRFQKINPPVDKPSDMMNLGELLKVAFTMAGDYIIVEKTARISCEKFTKRFKNPYLRHAISTYMGSDYNLMSFLYMMGHVTANDAGIPAGGSLALTERVEQRYLSLGGKITTKSEVKEIIVEDNVTKGVELQDGSRLYADWVVSTTPVEHCLKDLLKGKYRVRKIDTRLENERDYPIYTFTTAVVKCKKDTSNLPLSVTIPVKNPVSVERVYDTISIRNYSYDRTVKSDGSDIFQITLSGADDMYRWWKQAKENGTYVEEKKRIASALLEELKAYYPSLADSLEIIDFITPMTYERYLYSRHGNFQGFVHTPRGKTLMQKGIVKGLKKFILAGQWLIQSGGLPTAVMSGRFSAQRICRANKKRFVAPSY